MIEQRCLKYFLGANSAAGFFSFYDGFVSQKDGDFLWIIKGGPGCGKSSFMRMIGAAGERAGLDVEYAVCSGDPNSLDGVYIPALKTAYVDGTAPHIADATLPAADSAYLDMGVFYDKDSISPMKNELSQLNKYCHDYYKKAYALLGAAGTIKRGWQGSFAEEEEKLAVLKRVNGIIAREFGIRRRERGKVTRRFLSAYTCNGHVAFTETMQAFCDKYFIFENELMLGNAALIRIADAARETGNDIIICHDPLLPEIPEAVIVPELRLGFVVKDSPLAAGARGRKIRLDSMQDREKQKQQKQELRKSQKYTADLIGEAMTNLAASKYMHDRIEQIYNPNVDFDGVYCLVAKHISDLGLK